MSAKFSVYYKSILIPSDSNWTRESWVIQQFRPRMKEILLESKWVRLSRNTINRFPENLEYYKHTSLEDLRLVSHIHQLQ
jgi:hypothetical protein